MKISKELQALIDNNEWLEISHNQKLSEAFIEKFKNKVDWYWISCNQKLSEAFIEKFKDKVSWDWISSNQKLSEAFIEKFQDKVNWDEISCNQKLSEAFIEKFQDKVNWDEISCRQKLSPAFAKKWLNKEEQAIQAKKHATKTLAQKREEMAKYAKKWNLKFDGKFLYAFRNHDQMGRGSYNASIFYKKGKKYQDWHCDMDSNEENSFGLGIWPKGNTPVKVAVKDWGCAVKHDGEAFKKGRVFGFTVLD